jgi:hypothetical protein
MKSSCCIRCGLVGLRFLRYKCAPWLALAIAPLRLLWLSGDRRIDEQIRFLRAISKIDFVGVYGVLNDLLW